MVRLRGIGWIGALPATRRNQKYEMSAKKNLTMAQKSRAGVGWLDIAGK